MAWQGGPRQAADTLSCGGEPARHVLINGQRRLAGDALGDYRLLGAPAGPSTAGIDAGATQHDGHGIVFIFMQ